MRQFKYDGPGKYFTRKMETSAGLVDMVLDYGTPGGAFAARLVCVITPSSPEPLAKRKAEPILDPEGNPVPAPANWKDFITVRMGGSNPS